MKASSQHSLELLMKLITPQQDNKPCWGCKSFKILVKRMKMGSEIPKHSKALSLCANILSGHQVITSYMYIHRHMQKKNIHHGDVLTPQIFFC